MYSIYCKNKLTDDDSSSISNLAGVRLSIQVETN